MARKIGHQFEDAGRKFGEARGGNGAGIGAGVRAEAGAHAAQIFFDAAAGARRGAGANDGGRHFREAGRGVRDDGVAAAEIKLRGDFRKRARLDEDDLQAVRQRANGALGPGDRAFGTEGRRLDAKHGGCGGRGHRAPPGVTGRRTRTARLRGTRYFFAKACTCSGVTARNPSRIVFTRLRIAIEKSEAREIVHQAEARHVGTHAAFEHRVVVRAEFHFHGIELVERDSLLLNLLDDFIEDGDRSLRSEFRLVEDARDHLRGTVGVEDVGAAVHIHGDLLFEDKLAIDATGAAAVQDAIENPGGVPIGGSAGGQGITDGDGGKRAEFLFDLAFALFGLRRLGHVRVRQ